MASSSSSSTHVDLQLHDLRILGDSNVRLTAHEVDGTLHVLLVSGFRSWLLAAYTGEDDCVRFPPLGGGDTPPYDVTVVKRTPFCGYEHRARTLYRFSPVTLKVRWRLRKALDDSSDFKLYDEMKPDQRTFHVD